MPQERKVAPPQPLKEIGMFRTVPMEEVAQMRQALRQLDEVYHAGNLDTYEQCWQEVCQQIERHFPGFTIGYAELSTAGKQREAHGGMRHVLLPHQVTEAIHMGESVEIPDQAVAEMTQRRLREIAQRPFTEIHRTFTLTRRQGHNKEKRKRKMQDKSRRRNRGK